MQAGGVLGRDQHEEDMRWTAIQRIEVHARAMAAESSNDFAHAAKLAVRYRDTVADRGRAKPLAFAKHRRQLIEFDGRVAGVKALRKFLEHFVLGVAFKIGKDHFRSEDFSDLHGWGFIDLVVRASRRRDRTAWMAAMRANFHALVGSFPSASLKISPADSARTFRASSFSRCRVSWRMTLSSSRSMTE